MTTITDIKRVEHIEQDNIEIWVLDQMLEDGWVILSVAVLPEKKNGTIVAHYVLGHPQTKAEYEDAQRETMKLKPPAIYILLLLFVFQPFQKWLERGKRK